MSKILLVEDDPVISVTVRDTLVADHHNVDSPNTLKDAQLFMEAFSYDLLILDWGLPDGTGIDLCKQLRAKGSNVPVLLLTARSVIDDKEAGFAVGADDYLTKPFEQRELVVRVRALLKRSAPVAGTVLKALDLEFDTGARTVTIAGKNIDFQPQELTVLEFLMRNPGVVYSTDALARRCWDSDQAITTDAVYTCVRRVRKKLSGPNGDRFITTVHGSGYRFDLE